MSSMDAVLTNVHLFVDAQITPVVLLVMVLSLLGQVVTVYANIS